MWYLNTEEWLFMLIYPLMGASTSALFAIHLFIIQLYDQQTNCIPLCCSNSSNCDLMNTNWKGHLVHDFLLKKGMIWWIGQCFLRKKTQNNILGKAIACLILTPQNLQEFRSVLLEGKKRKPNLFDKSLVNGMFQNYSTLMAIREKHIPK